MPKIWVHIARTGILKSSNSVQNFLKTPSEQKIRHLYEFGPFRLDTQKRLLLREGEPVPLTRKVYETLLVLVENRDRVVSKEELMKSLWPESFVEESNLSQNIFVLRKALGDPGSERKYILTVQGIGYGFNGDVRKIEPTAQTFTQESITDELVVETRSHSRIIVNKSKPRSRLLPAALLALCLIGGGIAFYRYNRNPNSGGASNGPGATAVMAPKIRRSVAVIGFKNLSGRPQQEWLSTALSEMLATELAAGEQLRAIPGENTARTKAELALPANDSYSHETLTRLNQNLGADFVVDGSYFDLGKESGGAIRLDIHIQDTVSGETIASISRVGTEIGLPDLVSQAGADLRQHLGADPLFRVQIANLNAAQITNRDAARFYAEGLDRIRAYDYHAAKDLLQKSIAAEPKFVPAHLALADAYTEMNDGAGAREEAEKAYDLSNGLSREYRLSAEGHYRRATGHYEDAITAYSALTSLFPDNVDYGLRLASVQTLAVKGKDAIAALEKLRRLPQPLSTDPRIDLTEAQALHSIGDYARSEAAARKSTERAHELGATLLYAAARHDQCWALGRLGKIDQALTYCEEAKQIFINVHDRNSVANLLNSSAAFLQDQGKIPLAKSNYQQALAIYRSMDDPGGVNIVLNNLAIVERRLGNYQSAQKMYEESISISRKISDKNTEILALGNLAALLQAEGELKPALAILDELLAICRKVASKDRIALQLHNIGEIRYFQGDLAGSQAALEEAVALDTESGDQRQLGYHYANLGDVFLAEGKLPEARQARERALKIRMELGEKGEIADSQVALAESQLEEGRAEDAEASLRKAVGELKALELPDDEGAAHIVLIRTLLAENRRPQAAEAVKTAAPVISTSHDRMVRLRFAIAEARVMAADASQVATARISLSRTIAEAKKGGLFGCELDAQLALAQAEFVAGRESVARAQLASIEKNARAKGFVLLAHKAHTLL